MKTRTKLQTSSSAVYISARGGLEEVIAHNKYQNLAFWYGRLKEIVAHMHYVPKSRILVLVFKGDCCAYAIRNKFSHADHTFNSRCGCTISHSGMSFQRDCCAYAIRNKFSHADHTFNSRCGCTHSNCNHLSLLDFFEN